MIFAPWKQLAYLTRGWEINNQRVIKDCHTNLGYNLGVTQKQKRVPYMTKTPLHMLAAEREREME